MKQSRLYPVFVLALLVVICGCPVRDDVTPVDPDPPPSPIQVDSLKVLVWHETSDDMKPEHRYVKGTKFRAAVKDVSGELPLLLDVDADTSKADRWIQESQKLKRDELPWLMVLSPVGAWIGPLPPSLDGAMKRVDEVIKPKPVTPHKRGCN